ncbi:DsbA family protein [Acetobacteraceae bacterium H6797]|nr:DsbA family protein [Acetobacteraceae bacterium H6797]
MVSPTRSRFLAILAAGLLASLTVSAPPPALAQTSEGGLSPRQREEVVALLRQALKEDPTILRDAIAAMQSADQQARQTAQRQAIAANRAALLQDAADPVKGNPQGDVTIVEFFDPRCGYCKQLHPEMAALLQADPKVKVILKDLPILGPQSVVASRALLASQRQGKYVAFQDALLRLRGEPTDAALKVEAEKVGIDWARLQRDMADPALMQRLQANVALAQRLGIEGTPALVIGDTLVPGAVDLATLKQMVSAMRATGSATP